ncbi:hypothetical protein AC579_3128 [Pseudocercospora musae]|uniref:NOL1/NOP2/Sun domain family member 4 n=1 Tax=Pseudocercospora musae TaxID=113226 RepID=A0A139I4L3_9PEZI|nr:hypothetical protein AC579_3128 [Pseudocercospora musae]
MTKTHRKAAISSEESFHRHYAGIWGEERWQNSLLPALQKATRYACMLNRYSSLEGGKQCVSSPDAELRPLELPLPQIESKHASDLAPNCFVKYTRATADPHTTVPSSEPFRAPEPAGEGLQTHWNLDAASLLVAHLLNVQQGDNVLDLCAAPGGKSIALSQNIWQHLHADDSPARRRAMQQRPLSVGTLHSNEADGPRQRRLAANLRGYLPKALFDSRNVTALRVDGTDSKAEYELRVKTAAGTVGYDKVLVDAPCSSERHIIQAHVKAKAGGTVADEMANWRPASSKRLAETQSRLLMAGLKAVRLGGTVMYATCSIEPTENDNVIEKMLLQVEKERKKGSKWSVKVGFNEGHGNEVLEACLIRDWAEKTKRGWIVLPDHSSGSNWGPLFFAVLTKTKPLSASCGPALVLYSRLNLCDDFPEYWPDNEVAHFVLEKVQAKLLVPRDCQMPTYFDHGSRSRSRSRGVGDGASPRRQEYLFALPSRHSCLSASLRLTYIISYHATVLPELGLPSFDADCKAGQKVSTSVTQRVHRVTPKLPCKAMAGQRLEFSAISTLYSFDGGETSQVQPQVNTHRRRACFLDLPAELRNNIYDHCLVERGAPKYHIAFVARRLYVACFGCHRVIHLQLCSQMLRTCKLVHNEAFPILYGNFRFAFRGSEVLEFQRLIPDAIAYVRDVTIFAATNKTDLKCGIVAAHAFTNLQSFSIDLLCARHFNTTPRVTKLKFLATLLRTSRTACHDDRLCISMEEYFEKAFCGGGHAGKSFDCLAEAVGQLKELLD